MVALPPKSNGNGDRASDDSGAAEAHDAPDAVELAAIEKFETQLRQALPHMDTEAVKRVERQLHDELDNAEKRWLWNWRNRGHGSSAGHGSGRLLNLIAAAAVVMLVVGVGVVVFLAMNKGRNTITNPPNPPKGDTPVQLVVDELDVIIEQQVDPGAPPLFERPMIDVSPYQSLIGEQHVTQR